MKKLLCLVLFSITVLFIFGCNLTSRAGSTRLSQKETVPETAIVFMDNADQRDLFVDAINKGEYYQAIGLIENYKEGTIEKQVLKQLFVAYDASLKCTVSYDEFSETTSFYTTDISSNISAIFSSSGEIYVNFYTLEEDWVFWDEVSIKMGDEYLIYTFDYADVKRDVLSSGTCYETCSLAFDDKAEDLKKIIKANSPMIRFQGDRSFTAEISQDSQSSLQYVLAIYEAHTQIYSMIN